jgi:hypothetical protein
MRSRRILIHSSLTHRPILIPLVHIVHQLLMRFGLIHGQIFNKDTFIWRFFDIQLILNILTYDKY